MGIILDTWTNALSAFEKLNPTTGYSKVPPRRILAVGLDGAGKTTILYKMKIGEVITTTPTIGFNVETLNYNDKISFTVWDVGGAEKVRPLWKHYYQDTQALIFVVDSSDPDRFPEVYAELTKMLLEESLQNVPLLIFANKRDLSNARTISQITEGLQLKSITDRKWHIQPASGVTGEGLHDGLTWIYKALYNRFSFW